jgi:hypothetical protein
MISGDGGSARALSQPSAVHKSAAQRIIRIA